jgi:sterol desaturase/sphingolipid hydroxylase (fatty acid hydroxylase superfamily)
MAEAKKEWHWRPESPVRNSDVFVWPPRPVAAVKWLASYWLALSPMVLYLALGIVSYYFLVPAEARWVTFQIGWVAQLFAKNFIFLTCFAGALQLYFYTFSKQAKELKFEERGLATKNRNFYWGSQVLDNMFWSLGSGVITWTVYEALDLWSYAIGYVPRLAFADNPTWYAALFVIIPIWSSLHFYWIHRLLHWPPLYRFAHSLHHRNINIGPWSGISMHPLEHLLYFSSVILHFVVASSPIHVLYHLTYMAMSPAASHSGYDGLLVNDKKRVELGDFFHQLHHRYFECNYGTIEMPWDKWFGSFHDGTSEATDMVRERRRKMHGPT